jgi:hypothetical protein
MWSIFRRKSRDARELVTLIEEDLGQDRSPETGTIDELFERYGPEAPDSRGMGSPALRAAIVQARDEERWAEAVPVFLDEAIRQPDYATPHFWLVVFLEHEGRTRSAINVAKNAAMRCKKKQELLMQAAELALFSGSVRESIHLFTQSIATVGRTPRHDEFAQQRSFLFMAELFDIFGDSAGARWAYQIQSITELDEEYIHKIRSAARHATEEEQALIKAELPGIRKELQK